MFNDKMSAPGSAAFFEAVEARRSYYVISDESPISNEKIQEIVEKAVKHAPTSFNMQSSRAIVVTGQKNKELWQLVERTHLAILGDDQAQIDGAKQRFKGFSAGYGSVLFFEDEHVVDGWIGKMPNLSGPFKIWSDTQNGMLQYIVWTALKLEGLGASLQHYSQLSPETQSEVCKFFDVPQTWRNTAIMPFGTPTAGPGAPTHPKTFQPVEERVKVFFS